MDAQGWAQEAKEDASLVYRHGDSGCTLQKIARSTGDAGPRFVWLLFTRSYRLLETFEQSREEPPPFFDAESILVGIRADVDRDPEYSTIDFSATYSWG